MNIELIGRIWHASLLVPKDVRETLGKTRFKQSLGTANRREAIHLAAPIVAHWKAQIKQARGSTNAVANEALRWKQALMQAPDEDTLDTWEHVLGDKVEAIAETKGYEAAQEFSDIATGRATPSNQYFETWKDQIKLVAKTKDQMVKDVGLLVAEFSTLQAINKASVRHWIDKLLEDGKGDASIRRILSFCRNYWKYVKRYDAVDKESAPFDGVFEAAPKTKRRTTNLPYAPDDVVQLWTAATERPMGKAKDAPKDVQLAELIMLGAYSGARIEELCAVKTTKVTSQVVPSIRKHGGYINGQEALPAEQQAQTLQVVQQEAQRVGLCALEEREARSEAFKLLGSGRRKKRKGPRMKPPEDPRSGV